MQIKNITNMKHEWADGCKARSHGSDQVLMIYPVDGDIQRSNNSGQKVGIKHLPYDMDRSAILRDLMDITENNIKLVPYNQPVRDKGNLDIFVDFCIQRFRDQK